MKDAKNTARIRVTCRDEDELKRVKEVAERISAPRTRVLRDQLYPVRVDNANRIAVLDQNGNLRLGIMEAMVAENEVQISKIAWLSRRI